MVIWSQEKFIFHGGEEFVFLCFSYITFPAHDMQFYFELSEEDIAVIKNVGLEHISFINLDNPFLPFERQQAKNQSHKI